MKTLMICTVLIMFTGSFGKAQSVNEYDVKKIEAVVERIFEAWREGDAVKYANEFEDDIDYVVWNGMKFKGRAANIRSHQQIFDTFYKGTRVETKIVSIRFLSQEVAAVHLEAQLFRGETRVPNVPPVRPLLIMKKSKKGWKIAVFQNTPIIKRGELVVGRLMEKQS